MNIKRYVAAALTVAMMLGIVSCTSGGAGSTDKTGEKNGDIYVIYTSDVHCGIRDGFGYAGLMQIRNSLEAQGYETILVDNGDAVQGDTIGTISKGETIIDLMNELHYDIAIPGNHEFDYGMDRFMELTEKADFPYISCNFNKDGELVFEPYVIKEVAGMRIAFVGVTTPETLTDCTPSIFKDESGKYIYNFKGESTGEELYSAVQDAVDAARAEGVDYVYVMSHLGMNAEAHPWTYADLIEHTTGIDVLLDGHSHDSEQFIVKDKEGHDVIRTSSGTKLSGIGYSHISKEDGIVDTGIWSWNNGISAQDLLSFDNSVAVKVEQAMEDMDKELGEVIATSEVDLTIYDPVEKDSKGNPIRMARRAETNLGDFIADSMRIVTGADIGVNNGGGIRANIDAGDISYKDLIRCAPYSNTVVIIEVKGQDILDALEWSSHAVPEEFGAFLQVSGLTFEIDSSIPTPCKEDDNGVMTGIEGPRRVSNVMVGGEPIDPDKSYTIAGIDHVLTEAGGGQTAFDDATIIDPQVGVDVEVIKEYITDHLGGNIGNEYSDPYGQGRIVVR